MQKEKEKTQKMSESRKSEFMAMLDSCGSILIEGSIPFTGSNLLVSLIPVFPVFNRINIGV